MLTSNDDFSLNRYGLHLRFVNESDADFIVKLRTDPDLGKYLGFTSSDVELQRQWIKEYKELQKKGEDFYFMFETFDGKRLGVCRIYNISDHFFTIGSWIFTTEAPVGASILADIITRELAYAYFPDKLMHFDIRKQNINVIRYHSTFKPTKISEDELNYYYELSSSDFEKYKQLHLRMFAPKNNKHEYEQ